MGIREIKKGKLKLEILDKTLHLIKEKPFERIKVVDICHEVGISEVTFFKYFRKKEEVLLYFMLVWNFKRSMRLKKEGHKKGISGIYSIFQDISNTNNALRIMVTLISFIAMQKEKLAAIKLEEYDKEVISQEKTQYENSEDLDMQMFHLIEEAIEYEEIQADVNIEELTKVLSGIFYGVPLITYASSSKDLFEDYRCSLDYVFKGIIIKKVDKQS